MSWMDTLERKYGRFTFPYLLELLIIGQVFVFTSTYFGLVRAEQLVLNSSAVMSGEVWRLFTFMVFPMDEDLLFFAIGAYVTFLIGGSLQRQWGEFRFGLYVGMGWIATILVSFLMPGTLILNQFIFGALTLAFARLFPEVEFLIFFVLPVKVKYIGYLMWGFYGLAFLTGGVESRLLIAAGVLPFFVFFGGELLFLVRERKRTREFREKARVNPTVAFHVCATCGATEQTHPERSFRYRDGVCICDVCLKKEREG